VGEIAGSITVNGHPKNQATFARVMGYCEQVGAGVGDRQCFNARLIV
jgi:hypothetical protein